MYCCCPYNSYAHHHKQWYLRNKEYAIGKARERRIANLDRYRQNYLAYYENNRSSILEHNRRYREKNRAINNAKASTLRAKKCNAIPMWYGELDEFVLIESYKLRDLRESLTEFKWCVDHMIPINGFGFVGLHVWNNFQVMPSYLNDAKGNNLVFTQPYEWLEYVCQQLNPH